MSVQFADICESLYGGYNYYSLYYSNTCYSVTDKFKKCEKRIELKM